MIDRQLRRPAREAQRTRPTAYAGTRMDVRFRSAEDRHEAAQALVGQMFSTPKELRHVTEQQFDELFVPTETLERGRLRAVIALKTQGAGTIVVYAERERHWFPFRVVRVDAPRLELRATARGESPRPRMPYGMRPTSRPRIDWL
jgi:hypothetical protein